MTACHGNMKDPTKSLELVPKFLYFFSHLAMLWFSAISQSLLALPSSFMCMRCNHIVQILEKQFEIWHIWIKFKQNSILYESWWNLYEKSEIISKKSKISGISVCPQISLFSKYFPRCNCSTAGSDSPPMWCHKPSWCSSFAPASKASL